MSNAKTVMSQAANTWAGPTFIEDVFSTYLYTGNGSTQTITNGIDLAGEGGLTWIKNRSGAYNHYLVDTERGALNWLSSNTTSAQDTTTPTGLNTFNSDGFNMDGTGAIFNATGNNYASWTFRKAPRFFDVVTWTGDGATVRTIGHNLGVDPGCILLFCSSTAQNRYVYHRGVDATAPEDYHLILNATDARTDSAVAWNDTAPTSTEFTVRSTYGNTSGRTYVAYIFAHDPLGPSGDGSDGLIACGSVSVAASPTNVDLGWEPQLVIFKRAASSGSWYTIDNMRGWGGDGVVNTSKYLLAESSGAESGVSSGYAGSEVLPNGFSIEGNWFGTGDFIYIAIRRGPMRQPESGTEVFDVQTFTGGSSNRTLTSGFAPDMTMLEYRPSWNYPIVASRLTGKGKLITNLTSAEDTANTSWIVTDFDSTTGTTKYNDYGGGNLSTRSVSNGFISRSLRRAPGFFDVVAYTGDGVAGRTVSHNLGVAPEMIWVKNRSQTYNWTVYCSELGNDKRLYLNLTDAASTTSTWNNTDPTATDFTVSNGVAVNASGIGHIAYLFATLPGVSKVGSYTGNGTSQTIDCGFTSGARFVLIKRTDSTGDWYIWDTERGIVAANDPHLSLNTTAAEVTTDDSVDPDNSGFIVNQVAATNINVNAATYIFYAIA